MDVALILLGRKGDGPFAPSICAHIEISAC
jgi:hypothetical protein